MNASDLQELIASPTTSVSTAGRILRLSRNAAYEAVHRGDIPSLRMGKQILVLTAPLRRMLEIDVVEAVNR